MSVVTMLSLVFLLFFSPFISAAALEDAAMSPAEDIVTKTEPCMECEDMQPTPHPVFVTEPCDECETMKMPHTKHESTCSLDEWRVHPYTSGTCTYYIPTCSPTTRTHHHTHTLAPVTSTKHHTHTFLPTTETHHHTHTVSMIETHHHTATQTMHTRHHGNRTCPIGSPTTVTVISTVTTGAHGKGRAAASTVTGETLR